MITMPSFYITLEYANMHLIYGDCRCNGHAASKLYRERYPNAERYPDHRVFINVHRVYSEGYLPNARLNAGRPRADVDAEVLLKIENDSSISVRTIEANTGLPKSAAYHLQRVMIISIESSFVKQFYKKNNEDTQFLDRILWTDETTCKRDGYLNLHNLHSWSVENPHLMREDKSQYSFKINLWTSILNRKII